RLLRLQDVRADAIDVGGGPPHVRGGVERELVRRRTVTAVDLDVHRSAGGGPELLEVERQHADGAGDVARAPALSWAAAPRSPKESDEVQTTPRCCGATLSEWNCRMS